MTIMIPLTVFIHCDNSCGDEEHENLTVEYGISSEELFSEWLATVRFSSWRMVRETKKIFCSDGCEEEYNRKNKK